METIHIFHTNDIHSHLEHWPRIQQFLIEKRELLQKTGEEVFLFDIGDFLDRWHPFTDATMGKGNVALLNECQYTAVTIGNNEGINLPFNDLNHLYDEAKFDVLLANLYTNEAEYPSWAHPYKIYHTIQGTKIGVLGLTAPFTHLYELLGWQMTDPMEELKKWVPYMKENADVLILLSHLGLHDDEKIAAQFPEIDVILGAHTHHFLEHGEMIKNVLLGAAGKHGNFVGHVTLQLNEKKELVQKDAILYEFNKLPAVADEQKKIDFFLEKGKDMLSEKITSISVPLQSDPFHETNFSILLCEALREWCQADCAVVNAGLLLGSLSGEVTEYDLLSVCPHPINPCVIEVTGIELTSILEQTQDEALHHKHIKGLGFRGKVLGMFVYDQIDFLDDGISINGSKLELERTYKLALPDMFTFGHFFKDILPKKEKTYFLPEFLRDLLKWKLEK
ncbi:5'-nucleotidase [Bacillus sp. SORGH_AS 510]|uniref:bifunctional metallophosphatase/5'-nucleotidase n=1 Tax=Bacillus sp. SORGH_AS_0510 TaxID=3041771 RepID=UPI0027804010|nr:bifunctional UDP-sugar hydrolase/5'-nucleotidase [Bacillus sp. SORGH_AS_0510]MDQ1144495.1 5'-nucleotidase [Bacillus sp. SORGH_AS_0510]